MGGGLDEKADTLLFVDFSDYKAPKFFDYQLCFSFLYFVCCSVRRLVGLVSVVGVQCPLRYWTPTQAASLQQPDSKAGRTQLSRNIITERQVLGQTLFR